MFHYVVCSLYARLSYRDRRDEEENKVKHLISKKIILLFGIAVIYKVSLTISNLFILQLQDYLNVPYTRLLDLMQVYLWTQYIEVSYWILMGVIGYLFYKAMIQKVSGVKLRFVLKVMMVVFPVYVISQSFMNVFGAQVESLTGILRYQQFVSTMNLFTQILIALSFVSGLFICYVMRKNRIPACKLFLAHVLIAFLGKTALFTFQTVVDETNFSYTLELMDIGFIALTSAMMLYYLIKLNNQKSITKERVRLGGINYEQIRQ